MELLKKEKLDDVKKDGKMLNAQYFLELLQFIITTVKKQNIGLKKEQIDKRRKALADKDEDLYKSIVKEMFAKEEQDSGEFLNTVIEILEITQKEFEMTHSKLMQNPQTQELVMMAQ
jgi:hypothetical protein